MNETNWRIKGRSGRAGTFESLVWLDYIVQGIESYDEYYGEMSAEETFRQYLSDFEGGKVGTGELAAQGFAKITWQINGDKVGSERAPFQAAILDPNEPWSGRAPDSDDFLTHFDWPLDTSTGQRGDFLRLPVYEKTWKDRATRGGFIEDVTGWRPGPYQPHVWLPGLRAAFERAQPLE